MMTEQKFSAYSKFSGVPGRNRVCYRGGTIYWKILKNQYIGHIDIDIDIEICNFKILISILILKFAFHIYCYQYWYWKKYEYWYWYWYWYWRNQINICRSLWYFYRDYLKASLKQILFNCLYDFAKNLSICLKFLHFPWFRWKCYEKLTVSQKTIIFDKNWYFIRNHSQILILKALTVRPKT